MPGNVFQSLGDDTPLPVPLPATRLVPEIEAAALSVPELEVPPLDASETDEDALSIEADSAADDVPADDGVEAESPTQIVAEQVTRVVEPAPRDLKPVVVALIGLPGAGKSVVARALEDQLGLRRVCRDTIRQAMFPRCSYSFAEKRAAFRALLLALEINCVLGESSVIDGMTFSRRRDLMRVDEVLRRYNFTPVPIFLECPPDVARERIARDVVSNAHLARDRKPELVDAVFRRFETPPPSAAAINATQAPAEVCRLAVAVVAARMGAKSD